MTTPAIRVDGLGKRFRIGASRVPYRTIRDSLTQILRTPLARLLGGSGAPAPFIWALRDVTFEVRPGEVVGIIGRNGAGKSTLLRVLSRVTEPTVGRAELVGRVGSLLEVGTGFHPELTGRENIFLNAAILGMRRAEIRAKLDSIVSFAEVERFLETPVKHYSTGMYLRLAFAVAAHLEPEILLVDEALAVGDLAFQERCLGKMHEVARGGRTVLFVSHNMAAIRSLCDRALVFQDGQVTFDGPAEAAITRYVGLLDGGAQLAADLRDDPHAASPEVRLLAVRLVDSEGTPRGRFAAHEAFAIEIDHEWLRPVPNGRVSLEIRDAEHQKVFVTRDDDCGRHGTWERKAGQWRAVCHVAGDLLNHGAYTVSVFVSIPNVKWCVMRDYVLGFSIDASTGLGAEDGGRRPGAVLPRLRWDLESL